MTPADVNDPRTTPAPAAAPTRPAPATRRVLAQARFEAAALLSHGEQLLASLILPTLALLGMVYSPYPDLALGSFAGSTRVDIVVPGVLALAVISTAFTGQAILLGFERRWGVLRLLGTTPLGRGGLLTAKALSVLTVFGVQLIVLGGVGLALGWRPALSGMLPALVLMVLGAGAFAALAACLGGTLKAEAILGLANLIWILLAAVGAVLVPIEGYPGLWGTLVAWLPSAALGEGLRQALVLGSLPWTQALVLLVWAAAAGLLARRLLRWSD